MDRNTVVLITGSTGHLGRVVAQHFAEQDLTLALAYRSQEKMDDLLGQIAQPPALTVQCDLTEEDQVADMMKQVNTRLGGPDVLLNIAGGWAGGKTVDATSIDTWQKMIAINLTSTFVCCKHVLPYMLQAGYGRIVNVSSKQAEILSSGNGAYAVSKAGVDALTGVIANEVKGTGVSVVSVRPSIIDTDLTRKYMPEADFDKWVKPSEIAQVMLLLATDAGGEMNGAIIPLYGDL